MTLRPCNRADEHSFACGRLIGTSGSVFPLSLPSHALAPPDSCAAFVPLSRWHAPLPAICRRVPEKNTGAHAHAHTRVRTRTPHSPAPIIIPHLQRSLPPSCTP